MMLLAKAALGMGGALVLVGAYTFHEGAIRVDVDEYRAGGSHIPHVAARDGSADDDAFRSETPSA